MQAEESSPQNEENIGSGLCDPKYRLRRVVIKVKKLQDADHKPGKSDWEEQILKTEKPEKQQKPSIIPEKYRKSACNMQGLVLE